MKLFDQLRELTRQDMAASGLNKTQYANQMLGISQMRFSNFIRDNNPGRLDTDITDKLVRRLRRVRLMSKEIAERVERKKAVRVAKRKASRRARTRRV